MWKKLVALACLAMLGGLCFGVTIHLKDGSEIRGDITAKDNSNYYVENQNGSFKIPISMVRIIYDSATSEDVTQKYYNMAGFNNSRDSRTPTDIRNAPYGGEIIQRSDIGSMPYGSSTVGMTNYEQQMIFQIAMLNDKTSRISNTMWGIWGVSLGIVILSSLILAAAE